MKKFFLIIFTTSFFFSFSQTKTNSSYSKQAKTNSTSSKKYSSNNTSASLDTLIHGLCLEKKFSIVFYILLDSTLSTNPTSAAIVPVASSTLAALVAELNNTFKPICVSFENCSTVYIPNFSYSRTWNINPTESYVTANYYTDKTINIYFADTVASVGNEYVGYTYEPTTVNLNTPRKDVLVLDKQFVAVENFANIKHLLGHYFGLPHTFDEILPNPPASPAPPPGVTSQEFVNGTNCYTHGDGFCDTEADPLDPILHPKDGMGVCYLPPRDNMMSYYIGERCLFTQEQYNKMAYTIINKRLYLH
jgi:hypothetical protein